jgi:hypothetical protein
VGHGQRGEQSFAVRRRTEAPPLAVGGRSLSVDLPVRLTPQRSLSLNPLTDPESCPRSAAVKRRESETVGRANRTGPVRRGAPLVIRTSGL